MLGGTAKELTVAVRYQWLPGVWTPLLSPPGAETEVLGKKTGWLREGLRGKTQEKGIGSLERKLMAVSAGIPSRRVGAERGLRLHPPSWRSQTVAVVATVQGSGDMN